MSKIFKNNFIGTGSMKPFVDQYNELMTALNNISVVVPAGYAGNPPTLSFSGERFVFDFQDALIFTLNNIDFNLQGNVNYISATANVVAGRLQINVFAEAPSP